MANYCGNDLPWRGGCGRFRRHGCGALSWLVRLDLIRLDLVGLSGLSRRHRLDRSHLVWLSGLPRLIGLHGLKRLIAILRCVTGEILIRIRGDIVYRSRRQVRHAGIARGPTDAVAVSGDGIAVRPNGSCVRAGSTRKTGQRIAEGADARRGIGIILAVRCALVVDGRMVGDDLRAAGSGDSEQQAGNDKWCFHKRFFLSGFFLPA